MTIAIIAARFNEAIVKRLIDGCVGRLQSRGVKAANITTHHVPGAFELPVAAQAVIRGKAPSAVVCLGAIVRGDTPHFEYVAGETARGIARVALDESLPVIFGVLTTNTEQQAFDRLGGNHGHAGEWAADAAVDMALLLSDLKAS